MRIAGWRSREMLARYGASAPMRVPVMPTVARRRPTGCSSWALPVGCRQPRRKHGAPGLGWRWKSGEAE
jgi:hypothetical protein